MHMTIMHTMHAPSLNQGRWLCTLYATCLPYSYTFYTMHVDKHAALFCILEMQSITSVLLQSPIRALCSASSYVTADLSAASAAVFLHLPSSLDQSSSQEAFTEVAAALPCGILPVGGTSKVCFAQALWCIHLCLPYSVLPAMHTAKVR